MNVLYLSAWYPNKFDGMLGLFVRKHALAVAPYCNVWVLSVYPDKTAKNTYLEHIKYDSIHEITLYYPTRICGIDSKAIKIIQYIVAYLKGFHYLHKVQFRPNLIHVNILTRTAVIAYIYHLIFQTPYIISEHWSRYLPIRNMFNGILRKSLTRFVAKKSQGIFAVSEYLKASMMNYKINHPVFKVIGNVVDKRFDEICTKENRTLKRILHISCFDNDAKNIKGIIRTIAKLSNCRNDFELVIIGSGPDYDKIIGFYNSLNMKQGVIRFLGEKSPQEIPYWYYNSDFFVLFSNYETSSVVVAESLYCGKPVITTAVGGVTEHITNQNGILIQAKDEQALYEKIIFMLDHLASYDSDQIQLNARKKYSEKNIGTQLFNEYQQVLLKKTVK